MRFTKLTATLFATTMMASMIMMPEATYSAERAARRAQEQAAEQRARDAIVHGAQVATLTLKAEAINDPLGALNAPAAAGNLTQALTTAVGAVGSVVHRQPIATIPDKLTVMHNIEVAALRGAHAATITAKEDIRKALGLGHGAPTLAGASPESLAVMHFVQDARAEHILHTIAARMTAGTVDQIRQHIAAPRGAAAGGQIPHFVFPPNPTPSQIMKAFARDLNTTVQEAVVNGVNPNNVQIDAWLTQFDVP